ncbi:MAG: hypothetical protein GDA53_07000 [Rhodobacteraceae bacterium]|nr:hypothetical protein [Paracoccaceae bacterium]
MRMRSRNLSDVIDNAETLDNSVKNLARNMETLTSDVHEIRNLMNNARPWFKLIAWILTTAGVAAIGRLVWNFLQGWFA